MRYERTEASKDDPEGCEYVYRGEFFRDMDRFREDEGKIPTPIDYLNWESRRYSDTTLMHFFDSPDEMVRSYKRDMDGPEGNHGKHDEDEDVSLDDIDLESFDEPDLRWLANGISATLLDDEPSFDQLCEAYRNPPEPAGDERNDDQSVFESATTDSDGGVDVGEGIVLEQPPYDLEDHPLIDNLPMEKVVDLPENTNIEIEDFEQAFIFIRAGFRVRPRLRDYRKHATEEVISPDSIKRYMNCSWGELMVYLGYGNGRNPEDSELFDIVHEPIPTFEEMNGDIETDDWDTPITSSAKKANPEIFGDGGTTDDESGDDGGDPDSQP